MLSILNVTENPHLFFGLSYPPWFSCCLLVGYFIPWFHICLWISPTTCNFFFFDRKGDNPDAPFVHIFYFLSLDFPYNWSSNSTLMVFFSNWYWFSLFLSLSLFVHAIPPWSLSHQLLRNQGGYLWASWNDLIEDSGAEGEIVISNRSLRNNDWIASHRCPHQRASGRRDLRWANSLAVLRDLLPLLVHRKRVRWIVKTPGSIVLFTWRGPFSQRLSWQGRLRHHPFSVFVQLLAYSLQSLGGSPGQSSWGVFFYQVLST